MDYVFLARLGDVAGRLYEVLSGKFYGLRGKQSEWSIEYHSLCELLPLTPQRYLSKAKGKLQPAHDERIKEKFLSHVEWRKGRSDFVITDSLGERGERERREGFKKIGTMPLHSEVKKDELQKALVKELHDRGVNPKKARELAKRHSENYIREKIEMFEFIKSSGQPLENPAGYLIRAIEENFQLSEEQKRKIEAQRKRKEQEERREQIVQLEEVKKGIETMRSMTRQEIIEKMITENLSVIETAAAKITDGYSLGRIRECGSVQEAYQKSPAVQAGIDKRLREELYRERFEEAEKLYNERITAIDEQMKALKESVK